MKAKLLNVDFYFNDEHNKEKRYLVEWRSIPDAKQKYEITCFELAGVHDPLEYESYKSRGYWDMIGKIMYEDYLPTINNSQHLLSLALR